MSAPDFTIEYCISGGPVMADGFTERHRCLTISSRDRSARHEKLRSASDRPGEPIGLFEAKLPGDRLDQLRRLADKSNLAALPLATAGGPGTTAMTISFRQDGRAAKATLTNMDIPIIERIEGLIGELDRLGFELNASPVAAAQIKVQRTEGERRFALVLTNIGREPICLADPKSLSPSDPDLYAAVQVAAYPPEKPGFTAPPLKWVRLPLQPSGGTAPIRLEPGASVSAQSASWQPGPGSERHLVQALWSDYRGVAPDGGGCYRLRGSAFSDGLEVTTR